MNKLNYEILSAIDNIDSTIMESEMNVVNSLMDSYSKAVAVLEYCDDNTDVDAFGIFQENVIMEADDVNKTGKPKKSVKETIIDILSFILSKIKLAYNFIKKKIKNIVKPINEAIVNKLKEAVGDDTITIKTTQSPDTGKTEVTVTTSSHDTEKEEKIKSKVESVVSSPQPLERVNLFGAFERGKTNDFKHKTIDLSNIETSVKIAIDNVEVTCLDYEKIINTFSSRCKEINKIFTTIDINKMNEPEYNRELFVKFNDVFDKFNCDKESLEMKKMKYADFIKYTNDITRDIWSSSSLIDPIEKFFTTVKIKYKNDHDLNGLSDKDFGEKDTEFFKSMMQLDEIVETLLDNCVTYAENVRGTVSLVNREIKDGMIPLLDDIFEKYKNN